MAFKKDPAWTEAPVDHATHSHPRLLHRDHGEVQRRVETVEDCERAHREGWTVLPKPSTAPQEL